MPGRTLKEEIDDALRAESGVPRGQIVLYVSPRAYEHIRSYVFGDRYRGAGLHVVHDQFEDWILRVHD
jgi:hypothetical protein